MRIVLFVVGFLAACSKQPTPNCERAVKHVFALTLQGPPDSKPKANEQAIIDEVVKLSLERCDEEGLTDAQRDCILAAKSLTDREFLMCAALVAKKPSWIIAPIGHPELLDIRPPAPAPPDEANPPGSASR